LKAAGAEIDRIIGNDPMPEEELTMIRQWWMTKGTGVLHRDSGAVEGGD
jgi:hypothetical protein